MGSSSDGLIRNLRKFRRKIGKRYAIERMILFGSRVRGDARRDSDVDLILVSPRFRRKNAIDRASPFYLEWDLPYPVDFLCYTPEEFEARSRRVTIVREALREGMSIPPWTGYSPGMRTGRAGRSARRRRSSPPPWRGTT